MLWLLSYIHTGVKRKSITVMIDRTIKFGMVRLSTKQ